MKIPIQIYNILSTFKFLVMLKKQVDRYEFIFLRKRQKYTVHKRKSGPHPFSHSYRFCVLTVKRTKYVDMLIDQINSLHYFNPYHVFDILCDSVCMKYLEENLHRLDYPDRILKTRVVTTTSGPWQIYKIQALLHAIDNGGILVDADMYWFGDLHINQSKALFFVKAYDLKSQDRECKVVSHVFKHPEWKNFSHYVTALVYLPYSLCTSDIRSQLLKYTKMLTSNSYSFLTSKTDRDAVRRLAEELAINFVFQSNLKGSQITVLKSSDSPGDRDTVQALYYGAMNQIME